MIDHYTDRYWNDLPRVVRYLSERATGDPELWWIPYFRETYAPTPFKRALVIACGNGWVEREFYDRGIAERFDCFDPSETYLDQAREAAGERPLHYFRASFETFRPKASYDLVVNVAALHHATYLYDLVQRIRTWMSPEGLFVNWDYVGPSRNQYPRRQIAAMRAAREHLPAHCRTSHVLKPKFFDILRGDPTEAVHSSDIVHAIRRSFDLVEYKRLGGGIAYQLLWNNLEPFEGGEKDTDAALDRLLDADAAATDSGEIPCLFAFFIGRPKPKPPTGFIQVWDRVREQGREGLSRVSGGLYPAEIVSLLTAPLARVLDRMARFK